MIVLSDSFIGAPLRVSLGVIVVAVVAGVLAGVLGEADLFAAVAWMYVLVLVHECGHAVASRRMGAPHKCIEVTAGGGMCFVPIRYQHAFKSYVIVSLGGIAAQVVLCVPMLALYVGVPSDVLETAIAINTLIVVSNVAPVMPLDGGHVVRAVFRRVLKTTRVADMATAWVSIAGAAAVTVMFVIYGYYAVAMLPAVFVFTNYDAALGRGYE